MNVSDTDTSIMLDLYPSVGQLVAASVGSVEQDCPVADDVAEKLELMFG